MPRLYYTTNLGESLHLLLYPALSRRHDRSYETSLLTRYMFSPSQGHSASLVKPTILLQRLIQPWICYQNAIHKLPLAAQTSALQVDLSQQQRLSYNHRRLRLVPLRSIQTMTANGAKASPQNQPSKEGKSIPVPSPSARQALISSPRTYSLSNHSYVCTAS